MFSILMEKGYQHRDGALSLVTCFQMCLESWLCCCQGQELRGLEMGQPVSHLGQGALRAMPLSLSSRGSHS